MSDSDIDAETLKVGQPLTVGAVSLLPVERIVVRANGQDERVWVFACKEPYALVWCDAVGIRAVGADAAAIPLEQLLEKIPELDAVLRSTDCGFNHWSSK